MFDDVENAWIFLTHHTKLQNTVKNVKKLGGKKKMKKENHSTRT